MRPPLSPTAPLAFNFSASRITDLFWPAQKAFPHPGILAGRDHNARSLLLLLLTAVLGLMGVETSHGAPGRFSMTGSLTNPRNAHKATLLQSGKVLAAGGYSGSTSGTSVLASAEVYDPGTGTWSLTGSMATARYRHTVTSLSNGNVLVAGGRDASGRLASAEVYNPATGSWSTTGSLASARAFHTATLLPSGKVLAAGGLDAVNAELYDPGAGTWSTTAMSSRRVTFRPRPCYRTGKSCSQAGWITSLA